MPVNFNASRTNKLLDIIDCIINEIVLFQQIHRTKVLTYAVLEVISYDELNL